MGRRQDSAFEGDLTAWHEAGHAVAHVLTGIPFYDAQIWVEPLQAGRWRKQRRWRGEVRLAPDGAGIWVPDEQLAAFTVAVLAGPETEARRIHQTHGRHVPLAAIRAAVEEDHGYAYGDFDRLPELLADAGMTRAEADQITADRVAEWWPHITRVAGLLLTERSMTCAEITAAIHRTGVRG